MPPPSSNWLALQKKLNGPAKKPRKIEHQSSPSLSVQPTINDSLESLKEMVHGNVNLTSSQTQPGKYLALDCEMVGVGIDGAESSLARVSIVNFHGAIQMDEFVRQKEQVVDYRTRWSGIRPENMLSAKPFEEVQKRVADLLKDRILVGHALSNDLKALLLSHPRPQTRDTQYYAAKFKLTKSKRMALRDLVKQELDLTIQEGEHSSVTDARATMAVYRLHRKEWERGTKPTTAGKESQATAVLSTKSEPISSKRKREAQEQEDDEDEDEGEGEDQDVSPLSLPQRKRRKKQKDVETSFPGGGRKGVSSRLKTIVTVRGNREGGNDGVKQKTAWWKALPSADGSKG